MNRREFLKSSALFCIGFPGILESGPSAEISFSPAGKFYRSHGSHILRTVQGVFKRYGVDIAVLEGENNQDSFLAKRFEPPSFGIYFESVEETMQRTGRSREGQGGFAETERARCFITEGSTRFHEAAFGAHLASTSNTISLQEYRTLCYAFSAAHEIGHLCGLWHPGFEEEYLLLNGRRIDSAYLEIRDPVRPSVSPGVPNVMHHDADLGLLTAEHPFGFGMEPLQARLMNDYLGGGETRRLMRESGFNLESYFLSPSFRRRVLTGEVLGT